MQVCIRSGGLPHSSSPLLYRSKCKSHSMMLPSDLLRSAPIIATQSALRVPASSFALQLGNTAEGIHKRAPQKRVLLTDILPAFANEIQQGYKAKNKPELAKQVPGLMLFDGSRTQRRSSFDGDCSRETKKLTTSSLPSCWKAAPSVRRFGGWNGDSRH
jgi:hypothetical protein